MSMHYQIYLDTLLVQEVIVNFYVLELCQICLMSTATHKRLMLASLIAGLLQVTLFVIPFPENMILFYILIFISYTFGSLVIVMVAFGRCKLTICIQRIAMHMSFLLIVGGIFMGLLPRFSIYNRSEVKTIIFLIAGAGVYSLLWYLFRKKRAATYYGRFGLKHNGICVKGKYFMDSGNGLVESISQSPVLLTDAKWFFEIYEKDKLLSRPVIYKSVGKKKGVLYAYCIDELVIYGETKEYTYEKVWVGVCQEDLFGSRDYQIIMPLFYGTHYE